MADILVRIPKDQIGHVRHDKGEAEMAFWRVRGRPARLQVGDYIWLSTADGVVSGAPVSEVTTRRLATDDPQEGWKVVWRGRHTQRQLDPPAPAPSPSRGFRYATDAEQAALRARYEEAGRDGDG